MKKAYLILENGEAFEGEHHGSDIDFIGELVFTTSPVGYLKTLSDPSYCGQIVIQTFPSVGNYGIIESELEGKPSLGGYIAREFCDTPSNFRSEGKIDDFLKENGIFAVTGLDTRYLTSVIRKNGTMKAKLTCEKPEKLSTVTEEISNFAPIDHVSSVGGKITERFLPTGEKKHTVALINYGAKRSLIDALTSRGCEVISLPYFASSSDVLSLGADGIILSEGPGDPNISGERVEAVRNILGKLPCFGIGLGHELMALALGGKTVKLPHGHRGGNQPSKDINSGKTYVTSQNHGFAVDSSSLPESVKQTYINLNDGSCEGISCRELKCFGTQFEADFLFDEFLSLTEESKNA